MGSLVVTHRGAALVGEAQDGESWLDAARRTLSAVPDWPYQPVPVDLSGEPRIWTTDAEQMVTIRPMTRGDLPAMARWRQAAHVHRWWHKTDGGSTQSGVTKAYGPDIDGLTPTRMWVGEVNGRSIGFVQDYRVGDYPDFALLAPDPDALGVDYAIGEPAWVGRGLGVRMLWAWMLRATFERADVRALFAAPDHRNASSLRMLDKLGFTRGVWFDEPQADGSVSTVVGCTLDVGAVLG